MSILLEHLGPAGARPDPNVWRADVGPRPGELQTYTPTGNAWQDGEGHLVLEARREPDGRYTSARLDTKGRLRIEAGSLVEVDVLLPDRVGAFPAIWFVGSNQAQVGYAAAGELDGVEVAPRWNRNRVLMNAHTAWYPDRLAARAAERGTTVEALQAAKDHYQTGWVPPFLDLPEPVGDRWHRFGVHRDGNGIRWYLDGRVVKTVTKQQLTVLGASWPFGNPFDLIVNVAVGSEGGTPVPDDDGAWSARMLLGPIRITQPGETP